VEANMVATNWSSAYQPTEAPFLPLAVSRSTRDAEVRLTADGAVIRPVQVNGGVYSFVVPWNVRSVLLVSRFTTRTNLALPFATDGRHLGVRVTEISIRSAAGVLVIPADDPRLTGGWYDAEREGVTIWRWTDGAAQIPWTNVAGPAVVTIHCATLAEYPIADDIPMRYSGAPSAENLTLHWDGDAGPQRFLPKVIFNLAPPESSKSVRIQWCLGMYSSGSTWMFNAIRAVGNTLFPGKPHIGVYAESTDQLPPGWPESDRLIIKSHHTDATATALVSQHADRIWISVRDPRDAVASAMTYMLPDFASALEAVTRSALHAERFIRDPRSVLLRYEDGFIDDPTTLDRFASAFSRTLTPQDRDRLFQQTRRTAIEAMIQEFDPNETVDDGFPGHRVHMETQWHTHHLNRTGEVGRWRHTLDATQVKDIERRLGPWMERFGYHP
jgi:hypothetical protein